MAESFPSINLNQVDLASLVAEHHAVLYRYALRLSGSVTDAEDLTQQTFLTAQTSLFGAGSAGLRDANSARAWLFTVLRNGYLKSRRRLPPLPAADLELDINSVSDPDAEDLNFWEQRFWQQGGQQGGIDQAIDPERLQLALDELPPDFKLVVLMFYFEDFSYKQIAEQLDLPIGTVMSRLSRAKQHLRNKLIVASSGGNGERGGSVKVIEALTGSATGQESMGQESMGQESMDQESSQLESGKAESSKTENSSERRVAEARFHS